MKNEEIVINVLNSNITQEELGQYLEVTRQTVAKISRGEYVKLSDKSVYRLNALIDKSMDEISQIIDLDRFLKDIFDRMIKGDKKYISRAHEGFKYLHYWLLDEKFESKPEYHEMYFGHMNNFYPRYNQAALFMRDALNRQRYPLLTYQVDYQKKLITNFSLKAFVKEYDRPSFTTNDINFPIDFKSFLEILIEKILPKPRFLIYKDYIDDDWQFILDNVKEQWIHKEEVYDLSRLLNYFGNEQKYYGPLIEDSLKNFDIHFDEMKIHYDCEYRAELIVKLINMISLEPLHHQKHDKSSFLFDSHGFKRDNRFVRDERRKLKRENK